MTEVGSDFSHQVIGARRGFHEFGTQIGVNGEKFQVIDVDVSPINTITSFNNLSEVRRTYEALAENLPTDEQDHDVVAGQITADLRLAEDLAGKKTSFREYIHGTVGVAPEIVPTERMLSLEVKLDELLKEKGMRYDATSLEQFKGQLVISDKARIRQSFRADMAASKLVIGDHVALSDEILKPTFVDNKSVWLGYLGTGPDGKFFLKANIGPACLHTAGKIGALALHEYGGHFFQMIGWKGAIAEGKISPAVGITGMHSPENTQAEAVAQAVESLLPDLLPPEERWIAEYQTLYNEYKTMVTHNAHLMVNGSADEESATRYAVRRLPFESADRVKNVVVSGRENPVAKACFAGYWPALEIVRPAMSMPPPIMNATLSRLYEQPMTPQQMTNVVAEAQIRADQAEQAAP